jgi:hypothetical protein
MVKQILSKHPTLEPQPHSIADINANYQRGASPLKCIDALLELTADCAAGTTKLNIGDQPVSLITLIASREGQTRCWYFPICSPFISGTRNRTGQV